MSTKNKLIDRFKKAPKDFTFDELVRLFDCWGFALDDKGKTSGSRANFWHQEFGLSFGVHRPHPSKIIKQATLKQIKIFLKQHRFI